MPVGEAALSPEFYAPLLAALAARPLSVADVADALGIALPDAMAAVSLLVAGGYAAPVASVAPPVEVRDATRRLNRVLIEEDRHGGQHSFLVAAATGAAVASEYVEMLALGLLWEGHEPDEEDLATTVLAQVAAQGRHLREDWQAITDGAEAMRIARQRVRAALERAGGVLRGARRDLTRALRRGDDDLAVGPGPAGPTSVAGAAAATTDLGGGDAGHSRWRRRWRPRRRPGCPCRPRQPSPPGIPVLAPPAIPLVVAPPEPPPPPPPWSMPPPAPPAPPVVDRWCPAACDSARATSPTHAAGGADPAEPPGAVTTVAPKELGPPLAAAAPPPPTTTA